MAKNRKQNITEAFKERVESAISPWRISQYRPPFKKEELIAMAVVLSRDKPLTITKVVIWITQTFSFYRCDLRSLSDLIEHILPSDVACLLGQRRQHAAGFWMDLQEILNHVEFPIGLRRLDSTELSVCSPAVHHQGTLVGVLGSIMQDDKTPFRFFDLPAELRSYIYELTFAYPRSGIQALVPTDREKTDHERSHPRGKKSTKLTIKTYFSVMTRDWHQDFSFAAWDVMNRATIHKKPMAIDGLRTRKLPDILRPLLVCHQMYDEALPIFYRLNHFHFEDTHSLSLFLQKAPEQILQYISSISVTYPARGRGHSGAHTAFGYLAKMKLRSLQLRIEERRWTAKGKDPLNMPGISRLRGVKVDRVDFHGSSPVIEAAIKAGMLRPKPEAQDEPAALTKKRKAAGGRPDGAKWVGTVKKIKTS